MILVSLNVDLATGKAFLAGGGSSGDWEEVEITSSAPSTDLSNTKIHLNRELGLIKVDAYLNGANGTGFKLSNNVFVGTSKPFLHGGCRGIVSGKDSLGFCRVKIEKGDIFIQVDYTFDGASIAGNYTGSYRLTCYGVGHIRQEYIT